MSPKNWIVGLLTITIAAGAIGFWYWNSPERQIRKVLSRGEAAIEAKDLDGAMAIVSLQYRDELGLAYLPLKKMLGMVFDEFESLNINLANLKIDIQKDKALVQADLRITTAVGSEKMYVVGSRSEPLPVRIALIKELLKWKVQAVNGIRSPFDEF